MKATHNPANTPGTDPTPADTLRDAALYLRRHGWWQGAEYDLVSQVPFPAACLIGAISIAASGGTDLCLTFAPGHVNPAVVGHVQIAEAVLADYIDPDGDITDTIASYNDHPGRTADEVIHLLEEVATDWDTTHTTGGEPR